jgi:ParB family chromosome partitioning protein
MMAEVAGATIAAANAGEKTKVVKTIIRGHLEGADGREKREGWVPRWMAFRPPPIPRAVVSARSIRPRWPLMPAPGAPCRGMGLTMNCPMIWPMISKKMKALMVLKTPMARMRRMTA